METQKIKGQGFLKMRTDSRFSWRLVESRKTKPLVKDTYTKVYKILTYTVYTLNKQELVDFFKHKATLHHIYGGHVYLDRYDTVDLFRNVLKNDQLYFDNGLTYKEPFHDHYETEVMPEELPEDFTYSFLFIDLKSDVELIRKRTPKEQKLIDQYKENESNEKIFKHFIAPTIQNICNEYGLIVGPTAVYFENREKFVNFLRLAVNQIIVKRFEEAGITVECEEKIGNPRSSVVYPCETIFKQKKFRIMEGVDVNEENLG